MLGGLGTVAAVLWAAAGLDTEQSAQLMLIVGMMSNMYGASLIEQHKERQIVQGSNLFEQPDALNGILRHGASF